MLYTVIMRNLLKILLGILSLTSIQAQNEATHNISIAWDNDMYFLQDRYYTNGIEVSFQKLRPYTAGKANNVKSIFTLKHDMYTPRYYGLEGVYYLDRPYSGALYLDMSKNYIYANHSLEFSGQLGILGPGALADKIQKEWHRLTNNYVPRGWHTQMSSDLILGTGITYTQQIKLAKYLKLFPQIDVKMSTYKGTAGGNLRISLGNYAPNLNELQLHKTNQGLKFFFNFYSGLYYRLFDATLQGGIFSDHKITVEDEAIIPWIFTNSIDCNVLLGRSLFTIKATFLNREIIYGARHQYGTVKYTYAF